MSEFQQHKYHDYLMSLWNRDYKDTAFDSSNAQHQAIYNSYIDKYSNDLNYLDSIEQYRGTSYYDTLYNNPYLRGRNNPYTPTGLESLGDTILDVATFGAVGHPFSSGSEARYYQDLDSQSNQFLTEQVDKMRQEDYDSASSQAARLRAAGQNPDLTGGVTAGAAAENDQPQAPVGMPADQDSSILQAASVPFSLVSGMIDLYKSFQGIEAANLNNIAIELANNDNAKNFVLDSLAQAFIDTGKDDLDLTDVENLIETASKADYSGYSRGLRKVIQRMYKTYSNDAKHHNKMPLGLEKRIAELRGIATRENWSAGNIQANPLYSDDFNELVTGLYTTFGNLPNVLTSMQLHAGIAEESYNAEYYGALDSSAAARATNSANELSEASNKHQKSIVDGYKAIDQIFKDSEDKLLEFANSGKKFSFFGLLGLMLLPTLKAQVFQGIRVNLPSLNITHRNNYIQ